jgi:hypothetical protein
VGLVEIQQKAHKDKLHRTGVFAIDGICGSRSAFCCVRAAKHRGIIFLLEWAQYGFFKKSVKTHYIKLVFLHLVGFAGDIAHSGVSGA